MPFDAQALSTYAQMGLGLAGFSGIGMLLTRSPAGLMRFEAYRLGIMLGSTLGATFLALLPLVLRDFGLREEVVCRIAAAGMGFASSALTIYFIAAIRYMRRTVPEIVSRPTVALVVGGHGINAVVQFAGAAGWLANCVGLYSVGLLWFLFHGTYQFGRILFIRPLGHDAAGGPDPREPGEPSGG